MRFYGPDNTLDARSIVNAARLVVPVAGFTTIPVDHQGTDGPLASLPSSQLSLCANSAAHFLALLRNSGNHRHCHELVMDGYSIFIHHQFSTGFQI